MKRLSRKRKSVVLAVSFAALAALAPIVYAACFGNITVYCPATAQAGYFILRGCVRSR